ncbi:MAG TPA: hypothetical protein VF190_11645 [Rhodothermales bacterium]
MISATRHLLLALFVALVLAATTVDVRAQADRLLSLDDPAYEYVRRLQRRGYLPELNPTALPYTQGEVAAAVARVPKRRLRGPERYWHRALAERFEWMERDRRDPRAHVGGMLMAGGAATNNDRLDPLRYAETDRPILEAGEIRLYPNAALQVYFDRSPFVAQLGLRHDVFYDVDPDGLDAVNRLYVRNEEAYVGVNTRIASVYLGRFAHHWAPLDVPAVLIGNNPRSYDQLTFRLGGTRLALRSVLAELDAANADGEFTGRADDDAEPPINRYLAAHRLDWRPTPSVGFSLSESALYSGAGVSPSIKFLSPVHTFLFLVDNRPKNEEHNGFFAASAWGRWRRATGSLQVMLDDFDFLNADEPASLAAVADVGVTVRPWLDLGATVHAVTALAYNTHQPEGRYLYLLRGVATEFSDFVHVEASAQIYPGALPSLSIEPNVHVLWQGEGDVMDPFPADASGQETLLLGIVEQTTRIATRLRFQPDPRAWMGVDLGVNLVRNEGHATGEESVRFIGLFEFGLRLSLDRPYGLAFDDGRH